MNCLILLLLFGCCCNNNNDNCCRKCCRKKEIHYNKPFECEREPREKPCKEEVADMIPPSWREYSKIDRDAKEEYNCGCEK